MNRLHEIEERLKAIALELDKATGETLTALENEVSELTEERNRLNAENQKKQELRDKVASGQIGTKAKGTNPEENKKERMAQEFMNSKKMSLGVDETRAAILSTGNIAKPTVVNGINDIAGAKVSSIIDLIKVVNCEGMGTNRVAYVDADMAEAGVQTEGSAAGEAEPTFNYVDITPTSVAVYSQISKQAKKQTPLNYKAKVTEQALLALRKKAASIATAKLQASALNQVEGTTFANTLLSVSDEEFNAYIEAWKAKQQAATDISRALYKTESDKVAKDFLTSFNNITDSFTEIGQASSDNWASGFMENLESVLQTVRAKISDALGGISSGGVYIGEDIPQMAGGGVLPKGQVGFLEGNGAEAVVPLDQNSKWISAVAEDMNSAISGNGNGAITSRLDDILGALEELLGAGIYLDTGALVGGLAKPLDRKFGQIAAQKARG